MDTRRSVALALIPTLLFPASRSHAEEQDLSQLDLQTLMSMEVTTTAQRRTEKAQDVPIAVSVIQGANITDIGAKTPTDLIPYVAGFSGSTAGMGTSSWAIRGISTTAFDVGSESSIGVFIDDAYIGRNVLANMAFFDVQRVEVLKGPQGTLFGRNTIAGAVNVVPEKPRLDETSAIVRAGAGNLQQRDLELIANAGISDRFALRLAAMRYEFDGYQTNIFDGTRVNGSTEWAVRASALARIGESSNVTVTAQHNSYDGLSYRLSNVSNGDGRFPDHIVNNVPEDPHETSRNDGINVRVESSLGDSLDLTSITDYRENSYTFGQNLDATPDLSINFFQTDVGVSSFSQELRLRGATSSITWFAGVSYWREHAFARNTSLVLNGFTATALGLVAPGTLPDDALLQDVYGGDGVSHAYAAYADGAWHLAPRWNLRFGTRFTRDVKDWISLTKQMDLQLIGPAIPGGRLTSSRHWSNISPRLVLDYSLSEHHLLYASVTRGYKAGGFNSLTNGVSILDFGPERVTAYELGIKSTFAGSLLQLNASGYYNDYRDLQVLAATNNTIAVSNAAQARVVGLELEGTWQTPLPGLQVFGNISYQDAVYLEGTLANIGDVTGKRLPVTPRFKLSLSSSYTRTLRRGQLKLSASFNGQDKSFDATNREDLAQPAYGVLNARIHYEAPSSRWGIALIGDNLLDKDYAILAQDPFALGASYIKARPRMYRAQVSASF